MRTITHLFEPDRLFLVWQNPEGGNRRRFAVGEVRQIDDRMTFRYLRDSEDFRNALKAGFEQHPAFSVSDEIYSHHVEDVFMRRLPPRNRIDFEKYLDILRLPRDSSLSDLTLLGYSGAKLPSDGFSLVNPFSRIDSNCELILEVAGFRYQNEIKADEISLGEVAKFVKEPDNSDDPQAIAIYLREQRIGYVNRVQATAFHYWMDRGMDVTGYVDRLNGRPDRPLVYLYVEVRESSYKATDIAL